ncbi:uncharacterized protein LOC117652047 [Thrips palmi]|uniref:Uncharacterized protein LOC117652047 n=1 Tax=Thrips palmi TaxID=161013 RepID=A0A6P9A8F4_THRPL|nr:uncharacterized protein LOC117652047 [Thrips palmi]
MSVLGFFVLLCISHMSHQLPESITIERTAAITVHKEHDIHLAEGLYDINLAGSLEKPLLIREHWLSPSQKQLCDGSVDTKHVCDSLNVISEAGREMARQMENVFADVNEERRNRQRRALLPFIGEISKVLFGTATANDLDKSIEHLNSLGHKIDEITKSHDEMVSVINENALQLQNLASSVSQNNEKFGKALQTLQDSIESLRSDTRNRFIILEAYTAMLEKVNEIRLQLEKIRSVHDSCKQKRLPNLLFPVYRLRSVLAAHRTVIEKKNMFLSIPDSQMQLFYDLPTATCTFSESRLLLVKLGVPLSYKIAPWKAFSISPNKFLNNGLTCSLLSEKVYLATDKSRVITLQDAQRLGTTYIYVRQQFFSPADKTNCVESLLTNTDITEIAKTCPLICSYNPKVTVEQYNETAFTVVNPVDTLHVFCGRAVSQSLEPIQDGRYLLSLGCECSLQNVDTKDTLIHDSVVCDRSDAFTSFIDSSLVNEGFSAYNIYASYSTLSQNKTPILPELHLSDIVVVTAAPLPTGNLYEDLPKTSRDFFVITWGSTLLLVLSSAIGIIIFLIKAGIISPFSLCCCLNQSEGNDVANVQVEGHSEADETDNDHQPGIPLSEIAARLPQIASQLTKHV